MKTFYINPDTGDLEFDGQNNIKMVEGIEEKVQSMRLLFSTNRGEFFLNTGHGFDFTYLQQKAPSMARIMLEVYQTAKQDPRVKEVYDIFPEFDRATRKLKVPFKVLMDDGSVVENEVNV